MPSSWRTLLSAGYPSFHHLMRLRPRTMSLRCLRLPARRWPRGKHLPGSSEGHRQEHPHGCCSAALSQPEAPALCRPAGVSRVRPQALRPPSSRVHAAPCARPQGQRWIRGPTLSRASPGVASLTWRARVVAASRHWPDQSCPKALERDARDRPAAASTTRITSAAWRCHLPRPKNEDISATATPQEEPRWSDLPD